jgi:hypothetical protein
MIVKNPPPGWGHDSEKSHLTHLAVAVTTALSAKPPNNAVPDFIATLSAARACRVPLPSSVYTAAGCAHGHW